MVFITVRKDEFSAPYYILEVFRIRAVCERQMRASVRDNVLKDC